MEKRDKAVLSEVSISRWERVEEKLRKVAGLLGLLVKQRRANYGSRR